MSSIAVVVMTYNEALNVRRCLESVRSIPDVFVVDSGSTDGTQEICTGLGATVVEHPYRNHASQWQWALENLPLKADWVLAMDADFIAEPALVERLKREVATVSSDVDGIYVRHYYRFGGSLIRFGGTKQYWLRIVRRSRAKVDLGDLVDFRFHLSGKTIRWREGVVERNVHDDEISTWMLRQDKFALRLAVEEELRRKGRHGWQGTPKFWGNSDQRAMWLRDRFLTLPLFLRPVLYFVYRYFVAGGFLDGRGGFLFHFLQGLWLRVVVDWKILQIRSLGFDDAALARFAEQMLATHSGSVSEVARAVGSGRLPSL